MKYFIGLMILALIIFVCLVVAGLATFKVFISKDDEEEHERKRFLPDDHDASATKDN